MNKAAHLGRGSWLVLLSLSVLALVLSGCGIRVPTVRVGTPTPINTPKPGTLNQANGYTYLTPLQLREAYGVESLYEQGMTGKGQTVVIIDSFGSPNLQADMQLFDQQYGLPAVNLKVMSPLGTKPFDSGDNDMVGWAYETTEDVQIVHAIAPDAAIVVMTSPVSETEGTVGLPEFLQLEQYAVDHSLGTIVSQSWGVSEVTLTDSAGQQEIARWNSFYQQATTQKHITFFSGSGDNGATDYTDASLQNVSSTPTTSFPADNPWVTSVGGTVLQPQSNGTFTETAWPLSGGGFSRFYSTPDYQRTLPQSVQSQLAGRRGVPDVSSSADVNIGLGGYVFGQLFVANGTSAGSPLWAALTAIANQMAGHPLGYLSPTLYTIAATHEAQDFHDITTGNNSVDDGEVHVQGYSAVAGWDAITGLGSPNAEKLLPDLVAASQN